MTMDNGLMVNSRMDELQRNLKVAKQYLAQTRNALRKAEQKEERAYGQVRDIEYEIACENLRVWGNHPDLAHLMKADGPSIFYEVVTHLAQRYGFSVGGKNAHTNQIWISFSLPRFESGAVERTEQGIRYFAKAMKPCPDGYIHFGLHTHDERNGAWIFGFAKRSRSAKVAFCTYGSEQEVTNFSSLTEALSYVEAHLWAENVIDEITDDHLT